jgi:hypothetical protein
MITKQQSVIKKNTLVKVTATNAPQEDIANRGISFAFKLQTLAGVSANDSIAYGTYNFALK